MPKLDPRRLAEWTGGVWGNGLPRVISGVSTDSRRIGPGELFVAIRGPRFDGHEFVAAAVRRGACGAVVKKSFAFAGRCGPLLRVADPERALRDMAANYRRTLKARVIAVTGSLGKTSVKDMTADVLALRMKTARTLGNWNNEYGLPLSVLNSPADSRVCVFELGVSHPGELAPLRNLLRPDWGVITSIGPVHVEYFGSLGVIAREKAGLFKGLPSGGLAFAPADSPWIGLLKSFASCRVLTVGGRCDADYRLVRVLPGACEARIVEKESGDQFEFKLPLPGLHVVFNAAFACAVARAMGMDWQTIRRGLEAYRPQPMRWQASKIRGVLVVNDAYNANPVSMAAAIATFGDLKTKGRKWLVLGGMHELGTYSASGHAKVGRVAAGLKGAHLVTVGKLGSLIADSAARSGMAGKAIFRCGDHAAAAAVLARGAKAGDAILFKGSRCERLEEAIATWRRLA